MPLKLSYEDKKPRSACKHSAEIFAYPGLVEFDRNLPGERALGFGERQREQAVFELGLYAVPFYRVAQAKAPLVCDGLYAWIFSAFACGSTRLAAQ